MGHPFEYKQISYVALEVSDLQASAAFYQNIVGMQQSFAMEDCIGFRCDDHIASLLLYQAEAAPGLRRAGFQLRSAADLQRAREHFLAQGYQLLDIPASDVAMLGLDKGFRLTESVTGLCMEFFSEIASPVEPFEASHTHIQRMGHLVLRVVDVEKAWQVFERDFAMVASDHVAGKAVWARCYPNPLHHSLALVQEAEFGLHHVNFMVKDLDDIGRARNRIDDAGIEIVFGPGRHKPSGSVFLYFLDPDGMTAELSYGMELIEAESPRAPRQLENSLQTMDMWGGKPKPAFSNKGDIVGAGNADC